MCCVGGKNVFRGHGERDLSSETVNNDAFNPSVVDIPLFLRFYTLRDALVDNAACDRERGDNDTTEN